MRRTISCTFAWPPRTTLTGLRGPWIRTIRRWWSWPGPARWYRRSPSWGYSPHSWWGGRGCCYGGGRYEGGGRDYRAGTGRARGNWRGPPASSGGGATHSAPSGGGTHGGGGGW